MSNIISSTPPAPPTYIRPTPPSLPVTTSTADTAEQAPKETSQPSEAQLEQAKQKAAQASYSDSYVISDKKFAIYKDASGQLITRYVSLRDGSVTYEPTPTFVKSIPSTVFIKA